MFTSHTLKHSISRALLILLRGSAVGYGIACAILFFTQRSFIYYPQPASSTAYPTIQLPAAAARVLVSTRPHTGPCAFIYFGGNAEDVTLNMPDFSSAFPGCAIYLLNYRGYGGSSGKPSEAALFADGLALFDVAHAEHANIEVVGRSLGSGVAVYVASLRPAARLVLVTPYDSVENLAATHFPYMPVKWMLWDKFESWKYAPKVTAPTLIIAAEHDEIVPLENTRSLESHFRAGIVSFKMLPGTTHVTIDANDPYLP